MFKQMEIVVGVTNRREVWQSEDYFSICEVDTNQVVTTVYFC